MIAGGARTRSSRIPRGMARPRKPGGTPSRRGCLCKDTNRVVTRHVVGGVRGTSNRVLTRHVVGGVRRTPNRALTRHVVGGVWRSTQGRGFTPERSGGSKTLEGANFRREQNFGGSKASEGAKLRREDFYFGTNTIVHMWEGQMCIWRFPQKAWFGRECWREFSVMANLAL